MLNYRAGLAELPLYDGSEREWTVKVNANESPMNLPPLVEERVMARLSRVAFNRYPGPEAGSLSEQIAARFGLRPEQIVLGNGSSEIIEKLFFAFGGEGRTIVYPTPSFSMYRIYAAAAGARGRAVPLETDGGLDREAFVRAVRDSGASLAVVCNPNNPTGTLLPRADIEYIAGHIDCALVVDEAYMEFAGEEHSAARLVKTHPHVAVARTFSKAYGLAAARVGYLLADGALAAMLKRAFMPYHMNVLSLAAADIVYQMRDEFAPRVAMLAAERRRMEETLGRYGALNVYPSRTNFVFVKYENARALNAYLEERGIGIRSFDGAPGLSDALRITAGTREENELLLREIGRFLEAER